jgi:uncharacterized DUF497 family protein
LSFEDAEKVFSGPCVTFVDDRFGYEETRLITLGSVDIKRAKSTLQRWR